MVTIKLKVGDNPLRDDKDKNLGDDIQKKLDGILESTKPKIEPFYIAHVKPIEKSHETMRNKKEMEMFVELPLLKACEILYDKNIQTVASSANRKNLSDKEPHAYIILNYNTLSEENKKIAEQVGKKGELQFTGMQVVTTKHVKISIPLNEKSTVEEVEKKAIEIANRFKRQKLTWGFYTPKEVKTWADGLEESPENIINDFVKDGYYFDMETNLLYFSRELYGKSKEKI